MKRIAVQPVVRTVWASTRRRGDSNTSSSNSGSAEGNRSGAELYPRPQNLYDLWQEYEFGLRGKKPSRRKVFLDVIVKLVNAGHASDTAVDEVYNCYDRSLPVPTI